MKRKDFIRNSSGIILGSIISPNLMANLNPSSTINMGVIGTGGRGKGIIKLLNNLPGINVIAVCDTLSFRLNEGFDLIRNNKNSNNKITNRFNIFDRRVSNDDHFVSESLR